MKKNVFEAIHNYLNGDETVDLSMVREEVNAEWERMNTKREGNKAVYAAAEKVLLDALTDTPQTSREIFDANVWPDGFTVGKLNYALRAMWADEVNKNQNERAIYLTNN